MPRSAIYALIMIAGFLSLAAGFAGAGTFGPECPASEAVAE